VRTLDARALYRHAPAAGALATAAVRWELRDLGLGWWQRPDGVWEIAGVDDAVIREFSQRRSEMDEVRKALEERFGRRVTHLEENTIAKSTRSPKQAVDPIGLRKDWSTRADRVGLDIGSCFDRADRAVAHAILPDDLRGWLFDDLVDPAVGLCAESTTFGRAEVMRSIADWSIINDAGTRTHYHVDLVFYHYVLKCFVLVDLKTGTLDHRDIGQMDFYVRYWEDQGRRPDDNPTIGLILCADKSEAMAKYTLLNDHRSVFAAKYLPYLPSEQELQAELERERWRMSCANSTRVSADGSNPDAPVET